MRNFKLGRGPHPGGRHDERLREHRGDAGERDAPPLDDPGQKPEGRRPSCQQRLGGIRDLEIWQHGLSGDHRDEDPHVVRVGARPAVDEQGLPRLVREQLAGLERLGTLLLQLELSTIHQGELEERILQPILDEVSRRRVDDDDVHLRAAARLQHVGRREVLFFERPGAAPFLT